MPELTTVSAHTPSRPTLSPQVAKALREAVAEHWLIPAEAEAALSSALTDAVREALHQHIRPEHLLIALKAIEDEVASDLEIGDTPEHDHYRMALVEQCVLEYFG